MKAHVALKGEPSLSTIDNFVLTGTFRMPVVLSEGSPFFFFFFFQKKKKKSYKFTVKIRA